MHGLLENDKIQHLSLANNPKLTIAGIKYISVYVKGVSIYLQLIFPSAYLRKLSSIQSHNLLTLDLSLNLFDKRATQYLFAATATSSLSQLILNRCTLRTAVQLEILVSGIKKSQIQHLMLHQNRIGHQGALSIGVMLRDYENNLGGSLESLELDGNDLSTGIQYIAQALKRNQNLRILSIRQCKLDVKGCVLIGEALVKQRSENFSSELTSLLENRNTTSA